MFYIAALDELIIFGGGSTGALQYDAWALMNVTERRLTQKAAARTR